MGPVIGSDERDFSEEFVFSATRSSGPGGQHVNKVSTRIELRFDVRASAMLCDEEKELILVKLANRINKDGVLLLVSQTERSQYKNKLKAIEKFNLLIRKALTPVKRRKKTNPTASSRRKRLEGKQLVSEKKARRKQIREE
jgi:ribosome-associated protein